jgi:hypothetical protein
MRIGINDADANRPAFRFIVNDGMHDCIGADG